MKDLEQKEKLKENKIKQLLTDEKTKMKSLANALTSVQ